VVTLPAVPGLDDALAAAPGFSDALAAVLPLRAALNLSALPDAPEARAWAVLRQVLDPEVPVLSVVDLGIVREVVAGDDGTLQVVLTPTYSGCPATEAIERNVRDALAEAGFADVRVTTRLHPAWTTDWIDAAAREKLRAYGIAPPHLRAADGAVPIRVMARDVACPRCGSARTERLSAFGATACKALYRCLACREPFEHFKAI
jgi:ring-1,2-phenylacetyl-CoA epoxidase subunit PaaD